MGHAIFIWSLAVIANSTTYRIGDGAFPSQRLYRQRLNVLRLQFETARALVFLR